MKKTFDLFKNKFPTIMVLSLMIVLPVYLIQEFLLVPFTPELPEDMTGYRPDSKLLWYFLGMLLVSLLIELYKICIIKLSYETLESRAITVSEIMDFSMRIWPKTILTTLLYALFVAFGFMLLFFPGMMMFVLYYFYIQVIVMTGIWGKPSLGISSIYARKMLNKTITIVLLNLFIQYCISLAVALVQQQIPGTIASAAVGVLIFFAGQFIVTFIDIFATVCVHDTPLGVDISAFKKKKENNVQY